MSQLQKRKRGQNFSTEERDKLVKIISNFKETILNKKTDGCTNEVKNKAWDKVTNQFNSTGTIHRTKQSLIKQWDKLKSESKIYYNQTTKSYTQTGGGPSTIKTDPVLDVVCGIVGRGCTGIIGVQDSDSTILQPYNEPCPSDYAVPQRPTTPLSEVEPLHTAAEEGNEIEHGYEIAPPSTIQPLWSRRRPQSSIRNERSEATASVTDSIRDVYKKKETIEEIKEKLLRGQLHFQNEEQEHKRELNNLQLQAAMIDVEIKKEILKQIKSKKAFCPDSSE